MMELPSTFSSSACADFQNYEPGESGSSKVKTFTEERESEFMVRLESWRTVCMLLCPLYSYWLITYNSVQRDVCNRAEDIVHPVNLSTQ